MGAYACSRTSALAMRSRHRNQNASAGAAPCWLHHDRLTERGRHGARARSNAPSSMSLHHRSSTSPRRHPVSASNRIAATASRASALHARRARARAEPVRRRRGTGQRGSSGSLDLFLISLQGGFHFGQTFAVDRHGLHSLHDHQNPLSLSQHVTSIPRADTRVALSTNKASSTGL